MLVRRAQQAKYSLESVDRMVAILSTLETAQEQSLDQVARRAGMSESTVLRYLLSLTKHDFVERNDVSGSFRLGLRLFRLGTVAIDHRDIVNIARPSMERLLTRFEETVNLATCQQNQVMLIRVLESPIPMRKGAKAGEIDSWHATSLGKALLSAMPEMEVMKILGAVDMVSFTPNTMLAADDILRDVQSCRARGYSIDDEESVEGLRCVGVAVRDHTGAPRHAVSVSGPKSRMSYSRIEEIGAALIEEAQDLSRSLGAR